MSVSSANAPAAAASKTRYVETLTSGTSWTVPAGVGYVNATLIGAGGSGSKPDNSQGEFGRDGGGGQIITTTVTTTPSASIAYTIGTGGASQTSNATAGNAGGDTTFTGATTALGGEGASIGTTATPRAGLTAPNGGQGSRHGWNSTPGGAGQTILEYWK